jgi:hypothetical protein
MMKQPWSIPEGRRVRISDKDSRYYGQAGTIVEKTLKYPDVGYEYLVELESGIRRWFKNIEVKLLGSVTVVDGITTFSSDDRS